MNYKSLLPAGLNDLDGAEFFEIFAQDFPDSLTRQDLTQRFIKFLDLLQKIGLELEVWVDGSFTTEKLNPNDIDLVVFASAAQIDSLNDRL